MRICKFIFASFFSLIAFSKTSDAQPVSRFSYEKYVKNNDTLLYRQLYPDNVQGKKYPLVIFLHGAGERGNENEAQLKWGIANLASDEQMKLHPAIVIAPQCPAGDRWSNFAGYNNGSMKLESAPSRPMKLVIGLIQKMMKSMPVDPDRIYITGLSMGGFGTFDLLARYPDLFAAAVPVCGGGDEATASVFSRVPVWIFHGAEDPTVNPDYSIKMADALKRAGAKPGLTLYPDTGHFSWIAAYSEPLMWEWMFRQRK